MPTPLRFWWVEHATRPSEIPAFPYHCHKFIVLREEDGRAHVIASDSRLDLHADLLRALGAGRAGPQGMLVGGGRGGDHFPGRSEAFGPPPEDVVLAILGEEEGNDEQAVVPDWVRELIAAWHCHTLEDVVALAEKEPLLTVHVDPLRDRVELERYDTQWNLEAASLPLGALRALLGAG